MEFVGRAAELADCAAALESARCGTPRIVVIDGEPGIGKTALVRRFLRDAQNVSVVWASGDDLETSLDFGVAQQLLDGLPATEETSTGGDTLAVGASLLARAGALGERATVVLVVDDVQWTDVASSRALLFCLRRLRTERVLVVTTVRTNGADRLGESWARLLADADRASWIRLTGLPPAEVRELAAADGCALTWDSGRRLHAHTGGNPLYVSALVQELPHDVLNGEGARLPAPRAYSAAVMAKMARLSPPARELVSATAVVGVRCPYRIAAALAGLTEDSTALDEAITARLIDIAPGGMNDLVLAHPLVRATIYEDLSPAHRRRLHQAAARVLPPTVALAHRVAAVADGTDRQLADDLGAAAEAAQATGRLSQASHHLVDAWRVDPDAVRGERSLFRAVELSLMIGDLHTAQRLADVVAECRDSAERTYTLAILAASRGRLDLAVRDLQTLASSVTPADGPVYSSSTASLAILYASLGRDKAAISWATRARAVAAGDNPAADALAWQALAWSYAKTGQIDRAMALLDDPSADNPDPQWPQPTERLAIRGIVRNWIGDYPGAIEDLTRVLQSVHAGASLNGISNVYIALGEAAFRHGDWSTAAGHLDLAISFGEDFDHLWFVASARSAASHLCAARGDADAAEMHSAAAQLAAAAAPVAEALAAAALARAHAARARSDWPAVVTALRPLQTGASTAADYPDLAIWRYRLAEACLMLGQVAEARQLVDALAPTGWGGTFPADRTRLQALIQHRVGNSELALHLLADGMAAIGSGSRRLADAELALDFGALLIQAKRRKEAAGPLLTARTILVDLGATGMVARCDRALVAAGVAGSDSVVDRASRTDALSAREQVVARLVASGMTNREVAAELYLSAKAIEYHLGNIFTKLDIHSRRELRQRFSPPGLVDEIREAGAEQRS